MPQSLSHLDTSCSSSTVAGRRMENCFITADAVFSTRLSYSSARSTSSAVRTPRSDHSAAISFSRLNSFTGSGFFDRDRFSRASTILSTASCVNPSRFSQSLAISYCLGCSSVSGPNSA